MLLSESNQQAERVINIDALRAGIRRLRLAAPARTGNGNGKTSANKFSVDTSGGGW